MTTKKCFRCKEVKDASQFGPDKRSLSGLRTNCYECRKTEKKGKWDTLRGRFRNYASSVKRLGKARCGMVFDLTIEQFDKLTAQPCHYCGQFSPTHSYCGVDRVDDTLGYTLANCVPCCSTCNYMKHKLSLDDFITQVSLIYEWTIKPKS